LSLLVVLPLPDLRISTLCLLSTRRIDTNDFVSFKNILKITSAFAFLRIQPLVPIFI
jgi:hypothetical protein